MIQKTKSHYENTVRTGCLNYSLCLKYKIEERETDCLCCQELAALNEELDAKKNDICIAEAKEFKTRCLNKVVYQNGGKRFASHQLLVTSHQLIVTSYQLVVTSHQLIATSHSLIVTSHQSLVTSHQLLVTIYYLLVGSSQPLVTSYQSLVTS